MLDRESARAVPPGTEVALTVDDLPAHAPLPPGATRLGIAARMIEALIAHGAHGTVGFVNGAPVDGHPEHQAVLRAWSDAGLPLGNHTFSHLDLTKVSAALYLADVERNDLFLASRSPASAPRYFRYTYLAEGDTVSKRNAVRAWLAGRGYTIAPVTIDVEDWAWNDAYAAGASRGDTAVVEGLKPAFLAAAQAELAWSVELAGRLFGRPIKHVLLLHIGAFTALVLDDLLRSWRAAGVTLIAVDAALEDPAYRIEPSVVSPRGYTFLAQVARSRRVAPPARPARLLPAVPATGPIAPRS
jgi:peptidoglycan-N-acetylglucosamine deacetylase